MYCVRDPAKPIWSSPDFGERLPTTAFVRVRYFRLFEYGYPDDFIGPRRDADYHEELP